MSKDTKENKKWNDAAVAALMSSIGSDRPVSAEAVEAAAASLNTTTRSVSAKLRNLDIEVDSLAKAKVPTFSQEQSDALAAFVNSNAGLYTYKEIAEQFPGEFTAKQVQGKLLALELTDKVRPAERIEVARKYTPEEESEFVRLAKAGNFIEDIATALGKTIESVRGKALSLTRSGELNMIPAQKQSHAKVVQDPVDALGAGITNMTVAAIAQAVDKTERGVKTLLTRRGIKVADYDGAAKKAKAEAHQAAATA